MKKILVIALICFLNSSKAQTKIVFRSVTAAPSSTRELIKNVIVNENGERSNGFQIVYNGDINKIITKLNSDLGNIEVEADRPTNKVIFFRKFKNPDWSDKKLTLKLESTSNSNIHMITLRCFDNKGIDCLEFGKESREKIKSYFEEIFDTIQN